MVVIGKQAAIIKNTGQFAEANAFAKYVGSMSRVPIVDAVIAYDCPYSLKTYLLVARNALYIPSMSHNLIPPFILREAGQQVNEMAKRYADQPTKQHHSIYDPDTKLRIPLNVRGMFSYFPTRSLIQDEIVNNGCYEAIFLTPDSTRWNPHEEERAEQEASFLDDEGELIHHNNSRKLGLIDAYDYDVSVLRASSPVSVAQFDKAIDVNLSSAFVADQHANEEARHCLVLEQGPMDLLI